MKRIAIQGEIGSFHDIAAHLYFENEEIHLICCSTFEQVFEQITRQSPSSQEIPQQSPSSQEIPQRSPSSQEGIGEVDTTIGLVAIENTIAGSLLHNYELLTNSGVAIAGEHKLHISHCICCLPDDNWDTITEIHSHPVALMQCRHFLEQHPSMKLVEGEDTAGSARMIARQGRKGWAAICHAEAARLYGLKVLENHIEDNKHNFTRFLIVSRPEDVDNLRPISQSNKSSIVFSLPHEEGSLSSILAILSFYHINLTKIQSLPIIGREWEYLFYVDVMYADPKRFHQSIDAITPLTRDLRILGEYKEGRQTM